MMALVIQDLHRVTRCYTKNPPTKRTTLNDKITECKNDYNISIIVRHLLIMSGDVELNPGPSKTIF